MKTIVARSRSRSHRKSVSRPKSECGSRVVFGCASLQEAAATASAATSANDASRLRRSEPFMGDKLKREAGGGKREAGRGRREARGERREARGNDRKKLSASRERISCFFANCLWASAYTSRFPLPASRFSPSISS